MNRDDVAWFAGFFEGEGNVRLGSRTYRSDGHLRGAPIIDICQVNKEPLEKCLKLFPFAKLYGPYQYKSNRQPHFKLAIIGRTRVEEVFNVIKSYLSSRRFKQFIDTFKLHDDTLDRPTLKRGPKLKSNKEIA